MYTADTIDNVRSVDIAAVVGQYVKLDRHNKACCPFHNEKTPSFGISSRLQAFKCFGCGKGGDGIEFVMAHENCDFVKAVETIAGFMNIDLEVDRTQDPEAYRQRREEKKNARQLLIDARNRYSAQLMLEENSQAMDYWHTRGYNLDTITYWQLGYAPANIGYLTGIYSKEGNLENAVKLGLVKDREGKSYHDVYIDRVIIPILDEQGEVITFAGRVIDDNSKYAKYINGAESSLYSKSRTLFGLYQAIPSIKKIGYAVLVEGYTDVISMHLGGAQNTVASCGTALTEDMVRLLKRYTKHVVIMRDGDNAGQEAAAKDMEVLLKQNMKVDIVPLLPDEDPDSIAKKFIVEYDEAELESDLQLEYTIR